MPSTPGGHRHKIGQDKEVGSSVKSARISKPSISSSGAAPSPIMNITDKRANTELAVSQDTDPFCPITAIAVTESLRTSPAHTAGKLSLVSLDAAEYT